MQSASGVGDRVPILDIGTLTNQTPGQSVSNLELLESVLPVAATVYPSCGEATVQWRGFGEWEPTGEIREWDNEGRSARRRRGEIRRMCAANGLGYLVTLTFEREPLTSDGVWRELKLFLRRLRRQLGYVFPFVAVIERGELNGRLHLHVCVGRWYVDLCVCSICRECAPPSWKWLQPPPAVGTLCLRCVWGNGIVHGPSERVAGEIRANGDSRRAAMYVSKYVSKELIEGSAKGEWRYRVARGFQPEAERFRGREVVSVNRAVAARLGLSAPLSVIGMPAGWSVTALHEEIEGWEGGPTWSFRSPLPELPKENDV